MATIIADARATLRSDLKRSLENCGVSGAALEALLAETAPLRHSARVEGAKECARQWYIDAEGGDPAVLGEEQILAGAAAILWADIVGIGGWQGCEGCSTLRHPAFHDCGKGRKQAMDGPAWSAAILTAAQSFDGGLFLPAGDCVGFVFGASFVLLRAPKAWRLSVAREGLRRACGLRPWHLSAPFAEVSAAEWAEVVNEAVASTE